MARLIDADALIDELKKDEAYHAIEGLWSRADGIRDALVEIHDAPTIDAVSVVRCKDCKYWEESQYHQEFMVCTYVMGATFTRQHDDFCSRGERMKGADDE